MSYSRDLARLARSGAPVVFSAQDLRDLTVYGGVPPAKVLTKVALSDADNGGGEWVYDDSSVAGTYTDNLATVLVPTGGNGAAAWLRDFSGPFHASWAGCSPRATPAVNTQGIKTIAQVAHDSGGGTVLFDEGQYLYEPNTHVNIKTVDHVIFRGAGERLTFFSAASPNPADWILILGDVTSSDTQFYGVEKIGFAPEQLTTRTDCNGLQVAPTNRMNVKADARFLAGHGFWFRRPWNASIDVVTYQCGTSTVNSMLISAGVDGDVANDVVVDGTTEQDYLGWRLENVAVLRGSRPIKLHGGADSIQPLHLHNITSGATEFIQTLTFSGPQHVLVSDESGGVTSLVPSVAALRTRINIKMQTQSNLAGAAADSAAVGVQLGSASSLVIFEGFVGHEVVANTVGIRLDPPGLASTNIDLERLRFLSIGAQAYRIVDKRTAVTRLVAERATGLHTRLMSSLQRGTLAYGPVGTLESGRITGGPAITDQTVLMLSDRGVFTRGVAVFQPVTPLCASVVGTIDAETPVISGQRLHLPNSASDSASAQLVRVTVGEKGVTATHDPANYWTVRIHRITTLVATLKLDWTSTSAAVGDGLQSFKGSSGISGAWHSWDFTQGLPEDLAFTRDQPITASLYPVGAPPALSGCTITLYLDIRV